MRLQIHLWPYRALYYGDSPDNDVHSHHAVQVCIGVEGELSAYDEQNDQTSRGRCLSISQDLKHKIIAKNTKVIALYFEPEYQQNQTFIAAITKFPGEGVKNIPLTTDQLEEMTHNLELDRSAISVWEELFRTVGCDVVKDPPLQTEDKRVRRVIDTVTEKKGKDVDLSLLSEKAFLSPGRLTHLFKQETGISISKFIAWWRVRAAINLLSKGTTLTYAAHASGFSDLPHMSKTFRQLFGFAPSSLFKASTIDCHFH